MKRFIYILCCLIINYSVNATPVDKQETLNEMAMALDKCQLSLDINMASNIKSCIFDANINKKIKFDIKIAFKMILCDLQDSRLMNLVNCTNQLSSYTPSLNNAKYNKIISCNTSIDISTYEEFQNIKENKIIARCTKLFSDHPNHVVQELTKKEYIALFFFELESDNYTLVKDSEFTIGINELVLYFEYMKLL